ncbi:MAG: PRC-barrel domain-containing protein [Bacteroidota bacterium]
MKRSLKDMKGFTIETMDGTKGKIKDFLFDEKTWKVRYIDADFGSFFKSKRVLLPMLAMREILWDDEKAPLDVTDETIENSPAPEDRPTVSREYEKQLMEYYQFGAYWADEMVTHTGTGMYYPVRPIKVPAKEFNENDVDTSLRSFKEVKGYHILATDGHLGHVEDIIVDDADWQLIYLIIDTSNWRPWSKKVILQLNWLKDISYATKEVSIDVDTEVIKNAPEIDLSKPIEEAFEKGLQDYYQRAFPSERSS